MFLKALEMTGFKSFAQTVQLRLEPGVTAVVGPNGSGKSNIVDAVRWVLGEQSARVLRGAKSEDVIFAGSAMRRPLGMAEVTLVLDNRDRRVSLDLEEIAIARRLYRNGDTEYLLNHRRARLRDVLDVAAQAGLGPDSYCVVGQGAIEQLAMMRPQERRSLIADAADIRRYEARLAEIESDLAQTQQNALRVSAVVEEVKPQLDRLRAQAERAEKHRDVRDEVEHLAVAWYGRALPAARAAREAAERTGRELNDALEAIRQELATIDGRRVGLHEAGAAARQRAAQAERELQETRSGRERSRVERATAAERQQSVLGRVGMVQGELGEIAAQLAAARQALSQSTASVEGAGAPAPPTAESTTLVADAQAQVERARTARSRAESELQRQRNALAAVERDEMRARARSEALQVTEGQRSDAEARLQELGESIRAGDAALRAAREVLQEIDRRQAPARSELDRALNTRRGFEPQLTAARRALDGLLGEERGLARLKPEPSRGGAARVLGDEMAVPARYRRALLVALGPAAQYQVVDADDTAWFVQEGASKSAEPVLVPVRRSADEHPTAAFREWVAGALGDRVKYLLAVDTSDGSGSGVFARYLGTTIVVPTLDDARAAAPLLARAQPSGRYPFQVASEDGHCLRWNGEHQVGPRATEAQSLQVEERQAALASAIAEAQAGVARAEREVGEASVAETSARQSLRNLDDERSRATNDVREKELALRGVRSELDAEQKRLARFQISAADAALPGQITELAARQQELRPQIRDLEEVLRQRADELAAAQAGLRSANEQHAALAAQLALAEERRARLRDAMQRDAREVERLTSRHSALDSEAGRLAQDEKTLTERLRSLDLELREWDRRVAGLEQEATAASAALGENAAASEAIALEFESAQSRLADLRAEQATASADAEHARGAVGRLETEIAGVAEALSTDASVLLLRSAPSAELAGLDDATLQRRLVRAQRELRGVGAVDYGVLAEYAVVRDRYQFLSEQLDDLTRAEATIREGMGEARDRMRTQFLSAFEAVNDRFKEMFRELFRGGEAELTLSGDPDSTQCGIDIVAQPPGKRLHRLATLSGGERSLVGAALLLGLISVNPSPFCMLDEVDAALDETNVTRFVATIREMARETQFVLVTHNRATMEMADALYGVTMSPGAISQVVSVRFEALTPS